MKYSNGLIKITNTLTGEYRYFTKDSIAQAWIGASQSTMVGIKANNSTKFNYIKYEIVDGSNVLYKDINNTI